jgi:hypothetical protein
MSFIASQRRVRALSLLAAVVVVAATQARADERYFTYSYEPKVLPAGATELEQWATMRNGRDNGLYTRWDIRTEFETGLTDRLTTAVYMNAKNVFQKRLNADGTMTDSNVMSFKGFSSEWKYKLSDPTADTLGVLLYQEFGVDRREWESETKLVLGRNFGDLIVAVNSIFEVEGKGTVSDITGEVGSEYKQELEQTLGVAYRAGSNAFGLEASLRTEREDGEFSDAAVYVGPTLHASRESWWATFTILAQVTDHYADRERTETRLILGMHL